MDRAVVVIAEDEKAKRAHQELFRWPDEMYRVLGGVDLEYLSSLNGTADRVHITGSWQFLLKVGLWSRDVAPGQMSLLLKKLGMPDEEIRPFLKAPLDDLFYTLYYGKRFEVLRKLCHYIRRSLQDRLGGLPVDCHMVVPGRAQIVASSL